MAISAETLRSLVSISQFSKGQATQVFDRLKNEPQLVVLKNNVPAAILLSPDEFSRLAEIEENYRLLLLSQERLANNNLESARSEADVMKDLDISEADIVFMGGGPDREQHLASQEILKNKEQLATYVEDGGVLLAICGGYQILGKNWLMGDEIVEGLSIIDAETKRANKGFDRLIENIALVSPIASRPVIGYENHAGRTHLGEGLEPFGQVISTTGHGNNDTSGADGVRYKNVIGSYLHGPLLGKNPEVADWLIATALSRKFDQPVKLEVLDDTVELNANDFMAARLIKK